MKKQKRSNPLPGHIQTVGDRIRVKRLEKQMLPYHMARKMGIGAALIRSWENGTSEPEEHHLQVLNTLLGGGI